CHSERSRGTRARCAHKSDRAPQTYVAGQPHHATGERPMAQSNLEIVQQAYKNFGLGDLPAMLAQMDTGIEWQLPNIPNARISGLRRGVDAVQDFFTSL